MNEAKTRVRFYRRTDRDLGQVLRAVSVLDVKNGLGVVVLRQVYLCRGSYIGWRRECWPLLGEVYEVI